MQPKTVTKLLQHSYEKYLYRSLWLLWDDPYWDWPFLHYRTHYPSRRIMHLWLFLYYSRIICLDELGQTFEVRLIMGHEYKDRHKTHYARGRTILRKSLERRTTKGTEFV